MPEFGDTAKFPAALAARADFGHPMDNFARVTQTGDISTTAPTTLTIVEAIPALWPTIGWLTFEDSNEVVHYNAYNAGTKTFTLDVRGDQGSAATTHVSGTKVGRYLTKQDVNQIVAEIVAIETALGIGFATFDATAPTTSAVGDAAGAGATTIPARRDHRHGREAFATNALVLGTAAAAGAATSLMRRDDTIAAFDATVPVTQAYSDAAATGAVAFAARRDHKHGMMAAPTTDKGNWSDTSTSVGAFGTLTKTISVASGRILARTSITDLQNQLGLIAFAGTATGDALSLVKIASGQSSWNRNYDSRLSAGMFGGSGRLELQDFYINGTSLTWVFHDSTGAGDTANMRAGGHAW